MVTKLELGAGDRPTPGYTHNDMRDLPHIELVCPAEQVSFFISPHSLTHLRATHLLEHFSHRETVPLLTRWHRMLKPGGEIYLEVPNLLWQAKAIAGTASNMHGCTPEQVVVLMYGEQDHDGNYHKTGFLPSTLESSLRQAGYAEIQVTDIGQVLIAEARARGLAPGELVPRQRAQDS